eukprot:SAG22_NODE_8040_length_688_cov_1.135823_1_plen_115_part_10
MCRRGRPGLIESTRLYRPADIPENVLRVGDNYTIRLWGAYRPGYIEGMGHDYNNTGEVVLTVQPGNLTARIGGGNRVVSTQQPLVLDGGQVRRVRACLPPLLARLAARRPVYIAV